MYAILWLLAEEPASTHVWAKSEWVPNVNARPQHSMRSHCSCLLRDSIDSLHFRFHLTCFHLFTSLFWSSRSSADLTKLRFVAKPAASTWNALTYICHLPYAPELWILKSGHTCALLNGLAWCDVSVCRPVLLVISKSTHTDRLNRSASQYNRREQLPWSLPPPSVSLLGLSTTKARTRFKTITRIFKNDLHMKLIIFEFIYLFIDVLTFKSHVKSKIQSEYRARN